MRRRSWLVLSALSVASGCKGSFTIGTPALQGSGVAKDETRPVEVFHALEAENALQVNLVVTQGAKPSLKISGDDNLVLLSVGRDGNFPRFSPARQWGTAARSLGGGRTM
jgi:hypothetical protein